MEPGVMHGACDRRRELAIALALIVQAFSYRVVLGRAELGGEECNALADAVERLIFA